MANQNWNVTDSIELVQGIERAGYLLLEELDKHLAQRDAGVRKLPEIKGIAVASIRVISHGVEIAIKTLLVQCKPDETPPRCHDLVKLFDMLPQDIQDRAAQSLKTIYPVGPQEWLEEDPDIRWILETGKNNYQDWGYIQETPETARNGIPKGLINVMKALRELSILILLESNKFTGRGKVQVLHGGGKPQIYAP